jgi:apolipoprotein D and lipocalin family protein
MPNASPQTKYSTQNFEPGTCFFESRTPIPENGGNMNKTFTLCAFLPLLVMFIPVMAGDTDAIPPVEGVDIDRYLGTWYEIARLPHRFEKDLVGVTATYSIKPNGEIEVLNQGFKHSLGGEKKKAVGRARIKDPRTQGLLKVSFFWIFWADYKIIKLDTAQYQWAVVTSSSKKYLWILSRTPRLDDALLAGLTAFVQEKGFDTEKIIWVKQKE